MGNAQRAQSNQKQQKSPHPPPPASTTSSGPLPEARRPSSSWSDLRRSSSSGGGSIRRGILSVGLRTGGVLYDFEAGNPKLPRVAGFPTLGNCRDFRYVARNTLGLLSTGAGGRKCVVFIDDTRLQFAPAGADIEYFDGLQTFSQADPDMLRDLPVLRSFPGPNPPRNHLNDTPPRDVVQLKPVNLSGSVYRLAGVPPVSWSASPHCLVAGDFLSLINVENATGVARLKHYFCFFSCCHLPWRNHGCWTGYKTIECVDLPSMKIVLKEEAHKGNTHALCRCDEGKVVASAGSRGVGNLYDLSGPKGIAKIGKMDISKYSSGAGDIFYVPENQLVVILCGTHVPIFDRRALERPVRVISNVVSTSDAYGTMERLSQSLAVCSAEGGKYQDQNVSVIDFMKGKVVSRGLGSSAGLCPIGEFDEAALGLEAEMANERVEYLLSLREKLGDWARVDVGGRLTLFVPVGCGSMPSLLTT